MLREARERRGLSLRAVARIAKRSHSYLSELENDKHSPSIETLEELGTLYELQPWEAALGQTRAEFLASLPAPRGSPLQQQLAALVERHGEQAVADLLFAMEKAPDARAFEDLIAVYEVMLKRRDA